MSDSNRGAYAPPTDAPLSFDARVPVRGARPFPVTLIMSGLVLVGLVAVIFMFYRSGVRMAPQTPQAVGTPVGEIKGPAPDDAQPQDPAAGLQIYQSEAGQPAHPAAAAPNFVAPPEQPGARPAPAVQTPPPAAAPTTPVTASPTLRPALPPAPVAAAPAPLAAAPAPAARVEAPPPAPAKPVAAKAEPKAAPKVSEKAPAKPAAKAAVEPPAAKAVHGVAVVQIGAVSSTALADKTWHEAVGAAPGLAAGKGKGVERIEKDGHVLYRTSVTGFASKADAATFCAKLKSAGKACFVK
jgi:hypothetical protein